MLVLTVLHIPSVNHLITIHPSTAARVTVDDPSVLDFDMVQTGHIIDKTDRAHG